MVTDTRLIPLHEVPSMWPSLICCSTQERMLLTISRCPRPRGRLQKACCIRCRVVYFCYSVDDCNDRCHDTLNSYARHGLSMILQSKISIPEREVTPLHVRTQRIMNVSKAEADDSRNFIILEVNVGESSCAEIPTTPFAQCAPGRRSQP